MYTTKNRVDYDRLYYNEKEYLLADRFYPGESGMVILAAIAGLLIWSLAILGIFHIPKDSYSSTTTYHTGDLQNTPIDTTTPSP